jgi:hypothetical protein
VKHGDDITVSLSGKVHMTFNVTRDGLFSEVVELVTPDNERMIIPAKYCEPIPEKETEKIK